MKVLIVHAHPEAAGFNAALTATAQRTLVAAGHTVVISDLYRMGWQAASSRENFTTVADPDYFKQQVEERFATANDGFAPDVQAEIDKLFACDLLIFQCPVWWFSIPAILKGWVDRVFASGTVYGDGLMFSTGRLAGRRALLSLTTGAPQALYNVEGLGDLDQILYPIHFGMLRFVGFDVLPPVVNWAPVRVGPDDRQAQLDHYAFRLAHIRNDVPMVFPSKLDSGAIKH